MSKTRVHIAMQEIESFTITEFKERAREVIDLVGTNKAIAILRHKVADAVLISASDYAEFMSLKRERLNLLTQRYDAMVAGMQTPQSAAGVNALFSANPDKLGRVAVAAAKRG
jgi:antitoxin Phd